MKEVIKSGEKTRRKNRRIGMRGKQECAGEREE